MSAAWVAALAAAGGFVLSVACTLLVVGITYGRLRADVTQLQDGRADLATKTDVQQLAGQLSKIEGMFTMTLRSEHGPAA